MGSRYGGLKQLDGVGTNGETIMDYSIYDALQAGFGKIVFVIHHSFEKEFREKVASKSESGSVVRGVCELDSQNYLTKIVECTQIARINGIPSYKDEDENWNPLAETSPVSMNISDGLSEKPAVFPK
jgi:hypothetical protein